jgi:pteridine reductase
LRTLARGCRALAASLEATRAGSTLVLQADLTEFDRLPELIAHDDRPLRPTGCAGEQRVGVLPDADREATPAQFDALFGANARAPFFLAQAAAPHLRATRGAIVNLADIYGERPLRAARAVWHEQGRAGST